MSSVLFVDDLEDTADSLADIASALGHRSAVAYSGASALAITTQDVFDVIFLDLTLPDSDGRDVCLRLRQGCCAGARIIALTGHSELTNADTECFDGLLAKPCCIDDLERLLA
ncbi:Two component LuxR family transcriptional regulator [Burkholderia sp. 8Y]|uniref:response regulator n=1 Tax=Burkholderia sp. 8Y TaxID=2653133 RepID=UPI0012F3547F|nr:response regulator [Burkholderia sp. 8Y]VXC65331.1 Two component LuxR family transcriptional regulator [Burkholderia sp. 8Y]